jgi:trigger factor
MVTDAFKFQLPELNDDFAKTMDFESVEDMKNKLKEEFDAEFNATKGRALEQAIVMAIAKANPIEIPDDYLLGWPQYD